MTTPFFSIVMPVYNGEKYLRSAIDSVLQQSFTDWELLIVDDGSTDSSAETIKSYNDKRIRLLQIEHTGSANIARKSAFSVAIGKYIQVLDCDDYVSYDFLQKHYQRLIETDADCVLCDMHYVTDDGAVLNIWTAPNNKYDAILTGSEAFYYSIDWKIHGVFCTRTELVKCNYLDNTLLNGDELFSRILFSKCKKVVFDEGIYYYRKNTNSTTLSTKNIIHQYETMTTMYELIEFTKSINTEEYILKKVHTEYFKSIIRFQERFINERNTLDDLTCQELECIIQKEFKRLSTFNKKDLENKYTFLFDIIQKKFWIFNSICQILNKAKTLKNFVKKCKSLKG